MYLQQSTQGTQSLMDGICNCNFGGSPIFEISRALYNKLDANPADVREQLLLPIVSN
jgi:hypothetical protein